MDTQNTSIEEWKPIQGFEGLYSVSSLGRIRAETTYRRWQAGRILKPWITTAGYLQIYLCRHQQKQVASIHRLVAKTFIGTCPQGHNVNHKDGNKTHNSRDNLEYTTPRANSQHASKNELLAFGARNHSFKLTPQVVTRAFELRKRGLSQRAIAQTLGLSESRISLLFHGKTRSAPNPSTV